METMTTGMMKKSMIGMIQVMISQNHRMRMKMMVFLMTTTKRAKQTGTLKMKTGRIKCTRNEIFTRSIFLGCRSLLIHSIPSNKAMHKHSHKEPETHEYVY